MFKLFSMTKSDLAKALGGKQQDIADLLGLGKSRISQLPEQLPVWITDRVVGAAMRQGIFGKIKHLMEESSE